MEAGEEWEYQKTSLESGELLITYTLRNTSNLKVIDIFFSYKTIHFEEHINKIFGKVKEFIKGKKYCLNYVIAITFELKRVLEDIDKNSVKNRNKWKNLKKLVIILLDLKKIVSDSCSNNENDNKIQMVKNELDILYFTVKEEIDEIWEKSECSLTL
jgi:hypothetical protein